MCGINGVLAESSRPQDLAAVDRMNQALIHRGPDEGGSAKVACGVVGMRRLLPPVVYQQRKQGFAIPLRDWLNERFWEQLGDLYALGSLAARLFRQTELDRTIRDAREGASAGRVSEQVAAARVWLLAMVARWMQLYEVRV